MAARQARTLLAFILSLFAVAAHAQWLPINDAIRAAKQNGRLILLRVHTFNRNEDKDIDEWLAMGMQQPAVARALAGMNLAETRRKFRSLVVLDQAGDEVMTPESVFLNFNQFAVTLASLNRNAAIFAAAAELRAQHRLAESELVRGNGLSRSGELLPARAAFKLALEHVRKQPDALTEQRARLGIAGIDVDRYGLADDALRELRNIAFHPLAKDTGISAFLLLGHHYKARRQTGSAIDAYQHAWSLAPKPSPVADEARRYLEMLGATPASDVAAATGEVHLVFARRLAMVGKLEVTATAPAGAARVEFYLDGARVAEDSAPPFTATIALGSAPRVHTIAVKAFDVQNAVLGEESATINEVTDGLSVHVVAPLSIESRAPIRVEARAPAGATIESVELYWSETKLTTLT
ncbi:MAG TPA: Ig-like domain-containing protein, partial [Thermoanaerobaculia bacterium]|nr:Ig-like domain-containing protein [Thermoanaerobaculia bacterium]